MSLFDRGERSILALLRPVVPASEREDWQREWDGELAALSERVAGWPEQRRRLARAALRTALADALWLRLHPRRSRSERPLRRRPLALHAPLQQPPESGRSALWTTLWRDVAFGLRRLRRAPGFSLAVLTFLSLSIAATTGIFALVRSIVLEPLAYAEADRLVRILAFDPAENQQDWLSKAEIERMLDAASLESLAWSTVFPAVWQRDAGRTLVQRGFVSEGYFELLGVPAQCGRLLGADDDDRSAVVLGHDFWQREFQADEAVIGRSLTVDERSFTIVGVASPETYTHDFSVEPADIWLRFSPPRQAEDKDFRIYTAVARFHSEPGLAAAQAELRGLQAALVADLPEVYEGWRLDVRPLKETVIGGSGRPLVLLFAALGLLTLGICANLANLVTARLLGRRGELMIHLALGGERTVIARQLAIEGALLSSLGTALGLALARLGLATLPNWLSFELPRTAEIELGWPALAFALALAAGMTLLFSWLPARLGSRVAIEQELRHRGRASSGRGGGLRGGLIAAQVAVALPLLIGAGLLAQSLLSLESAPLGMRPEGLVGTRVGIPFRQYPEKASRIAFFESTLEELRAGPGVAAAGATLQTPFVVHQQDRSRFRIVGQAAEPEAERPRALYQVVTPGYFATLGTRLAAGRDFTSNDELDAEPVVIINEELRRRHFPDRDPLGQRLEIELVLEDEPATRTVVGVVEDIAQLGPTAPAESMVFLPHSQVGWPAMTVVARLAGAPASGFEAWRRDLSRAEPMAVVEASVTLSVALDGLLGPYRSAALLVGVFAALAAALGLLGLYALLSHDVARSERDVAIRMALGATAAVIQRRLLGRAARMVTAGILVGTAAAFAVARLLSASVPGLAELDPLLFAMIAAGLLASALLAGWLPAVRAARISPAAALRGD